MPISKKRIDWIDIAKFLAILFMVWCHTKVTHTVDTIVHSFHMPIFFILSGWCLNVTKHNKFIPFVKSRVKSLVIPYFFWGVILFFIWEIYYLIFDRSKIVPIKNFIYSILYNNAQYSPFATVQWFLTCLFFSLVIAWLMIKLCRENNVAIIIAVIVLFILGWQIPFILPFRLPLALDVAVSSAGFVLVGWFISQKIVPDLSDKTKKALLNPFVLVFEVLVGLFLAYYNGYVNMRLINFRNPILFYLSAIILSLAISHFSYYVCKVVKNYNNIFYRNILFLGKNTLLILMLNQLFIQPVKLILLHFRFYNSLNADLRYLFWFAFSVVLLTVMIPIIKFINKFLPFSVGK